MNEKLSKSVVLYFPPSLIGEDEGARCGKCMMFIKNGRCTAVAGTINATNGVCGLYVHGDMNYSPDDFGSGDIPKAVAGYVENGPTHCGNCEYYNGEDGDTGSCEIVAGTVAALGCCNHWEKG